MHAPEPSRISRAHAQAGERESAFGLIEIIVVLVIMAILMAIGISTFSSAKSGTYAKEAQSAGAAYDSAIAKFLSDNGNRRPTNANMVPPLTGKAMGPRSLLGKPYVTLPDGVSGGRIGVSMNGSSCGTSMPRGPGVATASGWVSYCPVGPEPQYAIRVISRKELGKPWSTANSRICWRGNTPQQPRCGG